MTEVSIHGTEFWIDGRPTYAGREFEGRKIQGLLFNVRAVQATFDDENPATRGHWVYPDTGVWDPERNTDEFCAALPAWRDHGVLAFTINAQGGGARYNVEVYDHYDNSAFTREGALKPAYLNPKPILINEDSTGVANLDVAWRRYVSWGYYDQGFGGWGGYRHDIHIDYSERPRESAYAGLSGFQTPPVNWTINTPHKRAFFKRVMEVTGYPGM